MPLFSANLGFLWSDLPLPLAIHKAKDAGFDAVECHWPYDQDPASILSAMRETKMPMLGLNTSKGKEANDFGLAALSLREKEAREAIVQAFSFGADIHARAVHIMAGRTQPHSNAEQAYTDNLKFACDLADEQDMGILIEPINGIDADGYFLQRVEQAAELIDKVSHPRLKIMLDCYHVHRMQDDPVALVRSYLPLIGHVQIASFPNRAEPNENADFYEVVAQIEALGYDGYFGAEYHPRVSEEAGLGWMSLFRS